MEFNSVVSPQISLKNGTGSKVLVTNANKNFEESAVPAADLIKMPTITGNAEVGMIPAFDTPKSIANGYNVGSNPNFIPQIDPSGKLPSKIIPATPLTQTRAFSFPKSWNDNQIWTWIVANWTKGGKLPEPKGGELCITANAVTYDGNMPVPDNEKVVINDILIYKGGDFDWKLRASWVEKKISEEVISINGHTGIVIINTDEIPQGDVNKYATEETVKALPTIVKALADILARAIAPAVTTENKVPQWNATAKTLKDGLAVISVSAGAGDAGKLVLLNSVGKIDNSMLPALGTFKTINTIAPDGSGEFKITAGAGITVTVGTNSITIGCTVTGIKKYSSSFTNSDVTAGKITITHSLNTTQITVSVTDGSANVVWPDINIKDANNIVIDFTNLVPLTGSYSVTVIG